MGIRTTTSACETQVEESPSPSVPNRMANRSGGSAARSSKATASSLSANAATVKPAAWRVGIASRQDVSRAQGSAKTVPMLTLIARRYSGSAERGANSTPSQPSPAAFRIIAPTFA